MLRKIYQNSFCKKIILRRYSALFMNGPKATENFLFVTPYIDFHEQIKYKEVIQTELHKRQIDLDLQKLENLWDVYGTLKNKRNELDLKKSTIGKELVELQLQSKEDSDHKEKLKIQWNLAKENIQKLKVPLWSAEEAAVIEFLKLPNKLHNLTPDDTDHIIHTHNTQPSNNKNHLVIGKKHELIHFVKNENYYLKGDAAMFELGAKFHLSRILRQHKFTQFSNPDFAKSLVIEGCGEDHTNSDSTFLIQGNEDSKFSIDSRLHLTGGSSLYSFLAYHTKNVLHNKVFPLKYFSMGRQYVPSPTEEDNMFHVSQSSAVQIFVVTKNYTELDDMLNNVIEMIKNVYDELGYHYRLAFIQANKLKTWESLRLVIEMYSSSLKTYVEVGNLSLSGDFISKRLMLTYSEEKQSKFPHILSGTILNVPRLLACVLEQDNDFALPEAFKVENWSIGTTL